MNHSRFLLLAVALAALAACQPKTATTTVAAATSPPVATVNGVPISRDFYDFYIKGISGKASTELTPEQRGLALDNLIHAELVGQQATKDGLDKTGDTGYLLEISRLNVLQQAASEKYLKDKKPTDQDLRAEYDAQIAKLPKEEYHARHILVATQPFAQKIVERLQKGEKFEELARTQSMDSSAKTGGDLGWFGLDRMVPEFAAAVATLKPGEYTHTPVQTQYGWHVIQLIATRPLTPPPFEQVKPRLAQMVEAKKFHAYMDEVAKNAKIEKFLDQPAAGAAVPAAPAGAAPAAAAPAAAAPAAAAPAAPASKN
ncbi:MAG: peptidylprolyl isomerase [Steroidobacterales bacterium]|jgi:peptidyl-prolyl cis-trans isomerase C